MDFKCVSNWHLEQCSVQDILTLGCLQSADRTSELHWWTELVDPTILVLKCIDDQYLLVLLCSGLANLPPLLSTISSTRIPVGFSTSAFLFSDSHNICCGSISADTLLTKVTLHAQFAICSLAVWTCSNSQNSCQGFYRYFGQNGLRSNFRVKIFLGKHAPRPP